MAQWVIENILARSSRPSYPSESVPVNEVDNWVKQVKSMGIKSIICLLRDDQLGYYTQLPEGLLIYYERQGFIIEHIPITDPNDDEQGWRELEKKEETIYQAFQKLPKPVLVYCSAGQQRTGRAVDYISQRWNSERSRSV